MKIVNKPPSNLPSDPRSCRGRHAFSLVELLGVMAVIGLLATLGGMSVGPFLRGSELKKAVIETTGMLEAARQYALTFNTHTYVAFAEAGEGIDQRVILASFASPHGVAAVDMNDGGTTAANGDDLISLNRPKDYRNVVLRASGSGDPDMMEVVPRGAAITLRIGTEQQTFDRIIHFTPSGEARISGSKVVRMGFTMQEARDEAEEGGKPGYSVHLSGITGQVNVDLL